jgi:hypothetical protein
MAIIGAAFGQGKPSVSVVFAGALLAEVAHHDSQMALGT